MMLHLLPAVPARHEDEVCSKSCCFALPPSFVLLLLQLPNDEKKDVDDKEESDDDDAGVRLADRVRRIVVLRALFLLELLLLLQLLSTVLLRPMGCYHVVLDHRCRYDYYSHRACMVQVLQHRE